MNHGTLTSRRSEGRFYIGMALAAIVIAVAGFAPAAIDTDVRKGPLTPALCLHGAVFSTWLLLFLVQTLLIPKGRIGLHRRVGVAGVVLAILMLVSGYTTAIAMARRGYDLSGDLVATADGALTILVFQLGDLVSFSFLVGGAIWYRRRPDIHKRLMLLATAGALMPAALAHIIGHSPLLRDIEAPIILIPLTMLLFAGAVHDRLAEGRIHPVSLWVPVALLVWANLRAAVIGPGEAWHRFAEWLIR
jgi:uncharacterized membrane protein YozB (DUF420 family)